MRDDIKHQRILETIPGMLTWTALLLPVVLSFFYPHIVISFLIIFMLFWLFRSFFFSLSIIRGYKQFKKIKSVNWLKKLEEEKSEEFKQIYHAIIFIVYKESKELVELSIKSYLDSFYPKDKIIFILSTEERAKEHGEEVGKYVKEKFGDKFYIFLHTIHPKDLPGEIKSKSANATWAAKQLKKILDEKNISYNQVISHNFDCDTRVDPQYFAYLTYKFLELSPEERVKTAYQPFHLYDNNIWDAPFFSRIIAITGTFVGIYNMFRPLRLHNFSSRSDCFQSIVDINYWDPQIIPEDSRQFYTSFFFYKGDYKVAPIFLPLHLDAVLAETYFKTFLNQYRQLRRWAWGIIDFVFLVKKSISDREIPWYKKLFQIYQLLENHLLWVITPIYLSFTSWIPFLINKHIKNTVLAYNFFPLAKGILNLAALGWLVMIYFNFLFLPKKPKIHSWWKYVEMIYQWLFAPVISIVFSSLAALDAQTRLMFGKYLEYQVTEKVVKNKNI